MRTWDFEHACYTGERTLHVPLTHVRSNSHRGSLAVATDDGKVGMVDLRQSVSLFATASAHPGGVNEISIAGDSLATCGFRAGCARYSLPPAQLSHTGHLDCGTCISSPSYFAAISGKMPLLGLCSAGLATGLARVVLWLQHASALLPQSQYHIKGLGWLASSLLTVRTLPAQERVRCGILRQRGARV